MSKTQLKKELARMSAEQLSTLILDLYAARKDAKDYLDFFVNPDIEARLDKARTLISKEMRRLSRGRSTTRVSRVKAAIASITSLGAGAEADADILLFVVEEACEIPSRGFVKESLQRSFALLLERLVTLADGAGMLSAYLPRIEQAIDSMSSNYFFRNQYKRLMRDTLADALKACTVRKQ